MTAVHAQEGGLKVGMAEFVSHHASDLGAVIEPWADDDFVYLVPAVAGVMALSNSLPPRPRRRIPDPDSHHWVLAEALLLEDW
jgi:hypothetical protein